MANQRLALVVAVDRYDHPALHQLAAPAADADALAAVLGDPELGDFEVKVVHNPTSWETAERVERVLADRSAADLVLLHFSCHGLKDDSGELYLAATNTQPDLLASTAVDAAWVNRVMQRSRARSVVLLLDCCYGGAFERGVIARAGGAVDVGDQFRQRGIGGGRGRVVITASTAMEYAFEGARLTADAPAAPSIFTGALVEGIRTGDADRDQDGHVALSELYDYVYDRVREQTPNQTPNKWEFGLRGDLYVARNPHHRRREAPAEPPAQASALVEPSVVVEPAASVEPPVRAEPLESVDPGVAPRRRWHLRPGVVAALRKLRGAPRTEAAVAVLAIAGLFIAIMTPKILSDHGNSGAASTPSSVSSGGTRDYAALLAMLPASIRGTCSSGALTTGNSATATCASGEFELWDTTAAMSEELGLSGATSGACTVAPSAGKRFTAALPTTGPAGKVICDLLDADQAAVNQRYCVEWGVDNLLLTGTFYSESGGGTASYRPTYDRAMDVLKQLP